MLEVDGLSAGYGGATVLRDVSLRVEAGQILTVLGPNGAGKSTLVRVLGGLVRARGGSIRFEGEEIARRGAADRLRLGIAQVPEGRHLFGRMSVRENLVLGNYAGHAKNDLLDDAYDLFPALKKLSDVPAGSLSGGQQQMLAVGRALMSDPALLLMDEPSLGLAPRVVDDILGVAGQLAARGVAVVLAEQNARKSLRVASSAIFLESGRVVLAGDPETLADDPAILHAYFGSERK